MPLSTGRAELFSLMRRFVNKNVQAALPEPGACAVNELKGSDSQHRVVGTGGPKPPTERILKSGWHGESWRRRRGPDEAEQRRGLQRPHVSRLVVEELDLAEVGVARDPPDLRVSEHFDPGVLLDSPGQVGGHVLVQAVAADHEVDLPDLGGEED